MAKKKIVIIGGGAAGLMAAGQAAEAGAQVLLLEKMKRPGRKICIAGKGRCNITNTADLLDFITHFGRNGRFLHQAFNRFFSEELLHFFDSLGLEIVTERGGRVFPKSGNAPDVLKVFLKWLADLQVEILSLSPVNKLLTRDGVITGVQAQGRQIPCEAVILATGGASYPATGSTGDGYSLAKSVGHTIVPIRPSLVPLITKGNIAGRMSGLSLRNIEVRMYVNGKQKKRAFGEMTFTKYGLSGPVILTLSGEVVDCLRNGDTIRFSIDLKPALDEKKLDARLLRDFQRRYQEPFHSVLRGLLPQEMVPVCLQLTQISADKPAGMILAKERKLLRTWIKNFHLEVTGYRPIKEAIITAGGVDTREIDPRTMESRKTKGLFIAGELLDIHADTGGYNLQAAFSTGWLAGRSAV